MEVSKYIPVTNKYHDDDSSNDFGTIVDLVVFIMRENDIPLNASIRYVGCGSHQIEFVWYDPPITTKVELDFLRPDILPPKKHIDDYRY